MEDNRLGPSDRRNAGDTTWTAERLARRMGAEFVPISPSGNGFGDVRNASQNHVLPLRIR